MKIALETLGCKLNQAETESLAMQLSEAGHRLVASVDEADIYIVESVSRTRAFIKIQDGCSKCCSYCIVPLVRGREKSQPVEEIITEVKNRVAEGVKEVVLTGTEVGVYDDNGIGLKDLLARLLAETDVARIRLSSLQPQEISEELIGLWSDRRLCPHFHLSLQSGSDTVLGRMRRLYITADYQKAVSLIRKLVPDVAITTDIIAGFPGETATEFQESLNFCREMEFARIHVFSYSPRPGTEAASNKVQIADKIKKQRSQILLALAEESDASFRQRFLGRIMPVLWEQQSDGVWSGHTANYIKVYAKSDADLTNRLFSVRLTEISGDGVWGEVEETASN